ncbi:MAG: glycosyltransferase family 39 protein [Planctomycetes bacterium]|nr:glycosyltransferase family 39 protein [Planctomycetota bacterium]
MTAPSSGQRLLAFAPWLLLAAAAAYLILDLERLPSPGWDESSIGCYALNLARALRDLEFGLAFERFQNATNYPPLGWIGHALAFVVGGDSWFSSRTATILAWGLSIAFAARIARKLVPHELAGWAALTTVLFAFCSWLYVDLASIGMLESWTSLALGASLWLLLRAHETGEARRGFAAGLALGALVLVKYNYAALAIAAAVGAETYGLLWTRLARRMGREAEPMPWRMLTALAIGSLVVPAWWYVWPFPSTLEMGARHREVSISWLKFSWGVEGLAARDLLYVFPIMACGSLLALGAFIGGVLRAIRHHDQVAHRLVALLALAGPSSVMVYQHREERFLVPTLVATFPLMASFAVSMASRIGGSRPNFVGALAAAFPVLCFATNGVGAGMLVSWAKPEMPAEAAQAFGARVAKWAREPWNAHKRGPQQPGDVRAATMAVAWRLLNLREPFAWISGVTTEFARPSVVWQLTVLTGNRDLLATASQDTDELLANPIDEEGEFRTWAGRYSQIVVLEPSGTSPSSTIEARWARWLQADSRFRVRAKEHVPDRALPRDVIVYERVP